MTRRGINLIKRITGWADRLPRPATRWGRLLSLALLVGVTGGIAAAVLEAGIHYGSHALVGRITDLGGSEVLRFEWAIVVMPAIGGLVAGGVGFLLCPGATGHGVEMLTSAFHHHSGSDADQGTAD